jgi:hypothetical protein
MAAAMVLAALGAFFVAVALSWQWATTPRRAGAQAPSVTWWWLLTYLLRRRRATGAGSLVDMMTALRADPALADAELACLPRIPAMSPVYVVFGPRG